jgi:heme-degrading monooxygenase HmoA
VAEGHEEALAERFRYRAGLLEHSPGFVRLDVGRPVKIAMHGHRLGGWAYDVVLTYSQRKEDFFAWVQSDDFRTAHTQRTPEGMFAGDSVFQLNEIIQSTEGMAARR